jgi:membrane protein YqaA with SNARE-associated domain
VLFGGVLLGSVVPGRPHRSGRRRRRGVRRDRPRAEPRAASCWWPRSAPGPATVITFAICRFGGPAAVRWVARGQHADRIEEVREQFRRHGWQIVVVGRLLPAGRIPVLLAAGALAYPWRRLLPASLLAAFLWAVAYASLGVVSGGIFDSPLVAVLLATVLVLLVGAVLNAVGSQRRRTPDPEPEPDPSACGPA